MDQMFSWVKPSSFEEFTSRGILVGEENGNKVFLGRVVHKDGSYGAAKIIPALKSAFYQFNGVEETSSEAESLDNFTDFDWVKSKKASLEDAVEVSGSYIGRGKYNGHIVVGTVDTKTNLLVGTCEGKVVNLSSYDVLIRKSKGSGLETTQKLGLEATQKSSSKSSIHKSSEHKVEHRSEHKIEHSREHSFSTKAISNGGKTFYNENIFIQTGEARYEHKLMKLMARIDQLEMEKASYLRDKESYEERYLNEQRKVIELNNQMKMLKVENERFSRERIIFEEKFTSERTEFIQMKEKISEYSREKSYLIKRISNFEEAIRYEKQLVQSILERYERSESYSKTLTTKLTSFEETIKTYQQRIFDMEGDMMITTSSSESMMKKITDYEETIKFLQLQMETYNKKLEISFNDNEFLVQKLTFLTQTLRSYQNQLECLNNKLQSSKTVIATAHSDLSRSNAQISKYQAALSSCYVTNGNLMTRVSGLTAVAQNQVGGDCSLNLVNHNSGVAFGSSYKSFGYGSTSSFMGMTQGLTSSDSYMSSMSSTEEGLAYEKSHESRAFNGSFEETNGSTFEIPAS